MNITKCNKEEFTVIGKLGSTEQGPDFVKKLWNDANSNFNEVKGLAKRDSNNNILNIWGAMSDLTNSFLPWTNNFSKGLYLAGVECNNDAIPPKGWTKWTIPSFEYIVIEVESKTTFIDGINYLKQNNLSLAGAVHDNTNPATQKSYMYFPIRKI